MITWTIDNKNKHSPTNLIRENLQTNGNLFDDDIKSKETVNKKTAKPTARRKINISCYIVFLFTAKGANKIRKTLYFFFTFSDENRMKQIESNL